jgi:hypothetical protein
VYLDSKDCAFVAIGPAIVRSRKNRYYWGNRTVFVPFVHVVALQEDLVSTNHAFQVVLLQEIVDQGCPKDYRAVPCEVENHSISQLPILIFGRV